MTVFVIFATLFIAAMIFADCREMIEPQKKDTAKERVRVLTRPIDKKKQQE